MKTQIKKASQGKFLQTQFYSPNHHHSIAVEQPGYDTKIKHLVTITSFPLIGWNRLKGCSDGNVFRLNDCVPQANRVIPASCSCLFNVFTTLRVGTKMGKCVKCRMLEQEPRCVCFLFDLCDSAAQFLHYLWVSCSQVINNSEEITDCLV